MKNRVARQVGIADYLAAVIYSRGRAVTATEGAEVLHTSGSCPEKGVTGRIDCRRQEKSEAEDEEEM